MDTMELDHDLLLMTIPSVMSDDTGLPGSKFEGFVAHHPSGFSSLSPGSFYEAIPKLT
jgi:hypothetical protein